MSYPIWPPTSPRRRGSGKGEPPMRLVNRPLAFILAAALAVAAIIVIIEVIGFAVHHGPLLLHWTTWQRWASRTRWDALVFQVWSAVLIVIGVAVLLEFKPRRVTRLPLRSGPATDAAVTRRGLARMLRARRPGRRDLRRRRPRPPPSRPRHRGLRCPRPRRGRRSGSLSPRRCAPPRRPDLRHPPRLTCASSPGAADARRPNQPLRPDLVRPAGLLAGAAAMPRPSADSALPFPAGPCSPTAPAPTSASTESGSGPPPRSFACLSPSPRCAGSWPCWSPPTGPGTSPSPAAKN